VEAAVNACLPPLYEVEDGITRVTVDPEKSGKKNPITTAIEKMGGTFRDLLTA
jgi:pyruvate ferredoxin oxidoreductase alpha subunit